MKKTITLLTIAFCAVLMFTSCNETKEKTGENEAVAEAEATAIAYTASSENSKIMWSGSKPTGTHSGTISLTGGELMVNDKNLEAGKFTIDMKSITVTDLKAGDGKENLEAHLMGTVEGKEGDFFNVNEFPKAMFEITSIEGGQYNPTVNGNLTIKGKTNPVSFNATVSYADNTMLLKSDKFTINRTQWGINYGSKSIFDNLGDKFISDDMELEVELQASKE
jgi:polyisoprenoid-binding protein YceI